MSNFIKTIEACFAPDGRLANANVGFFPRSGQTKMAIAVANCIEQGGNLVVEAGTGVGKTFAYLVPALLSGERVLLSTGTKTLQDQLFGRDLPRLMQTLGVAGKIALLKGRSNYLCTQRLAFARHSVNPSDRFQARTLAQIEKWAQSTATGDLAEIKGLDERSAVIPLATSTRDNCVGTECPHYKSCFVNLARKEALSADVVVINHHLFFADLNVRESGVAELLPSSRIVVFDEAHKLNEIGVEFSGHQFASRQILDFCKDALAITLAQVRGLAAWNDLIGSLEKSIKDLRLSLQDAGLPNGKIAWADGAPEGILQAYWQGSIDKVTDALEDLEQALQLCAENSPDLARLLARCEELQKEIDRFAKTCPVDFVRWLELGQHLRLAQAPLDIAQVLKANTEVPEGTPANEQKSWIFTSATLGTDEEMLWFTEPCGLQEATRLRVESPFDYAAQASIYIPVPFPEPANARHSVEVARLVAHSASIIGGRTLVLTTTLKALQIIADELNEAFLVEKQIVVLRQGSLPKRELIERFRAAGKDGQPGAILVASASFWEGVDIAGDALQLVVIDKLPFPPPNDPVVQARGKRLEEAGKSSFNDYSLPEAIVALKQGAGRLIRHEHDMGVLLICDNRIKQKNYGRKVLAALPPMYVLQSHQALLEQLDLITKASTSS